MSNDSGASESLGKIAEKIRAGKLMAETLESVSSDICALFGSDRLTVYILDSENAGTIVTVVKTGLESYNVIRLPIRNSSIAGYVALHKRLLNTINPYDEAELASLTPPAVFLKEVDRRTGYCTRQLLTAPILDAADGTLLGVLQVINSRSGQPFPEQLETLAAQLAAVLAERFRIWLVPQDRYGGLVTKGVISMAELDLAHRSARRKNVDLEKILLDEFMVKVPAIGDVLADHFGVPYEPLKQDRVRPASALRNLVRDFCESNRWVPVEESGETLIVMAIDPGKVRASRMAANIYPRSKIEYRVTTRGEFSATLDQLFGAQQDCDDIGDMLLGAALDDEEDEAKPAPEVPAPITDLVYFSATAPQRVAAGLPFLLGIWAHLQEQRADVLKQVQEELQFKAFTIKTKGPAMVPRGTTLAVRVSIPDFAFEEEDTILWAGQIGNCSFAIDVPKDIAAGKHIGTARLAVGGLPVSRLHFEIEVGEKAGNARDALPLREERPRTAFASYASENRDEVLSRIQGMQKLVPDLDVFLDIVSLRSGDNWARKLEDEIARRDVFYLFWSSAASESEWVEKEWRTALRIKGLDRIDPVPLEAPDKAPPPKELQGLHFNEWTLAYRRNDP